MCSAGESDPRPGSKEEMGRMGHSTHAHSSAALDSYEHCGEAKTEPGLEVLRKNLLQQLNGWGRALVVPERREKARADSLGADLAGKNKLHPCNDVQQGTARPMLVLIVRDFTLTRAANSGVRRTQLRFLCPLHRGSG